MSQAELVLDCRNTHGEGVFWNAADQRVWWTDIHGQRLWSLDPQDGLTRQIDLPARVCCFAPKRSGGFILALAEGLALLENDGTLTRTHDFEPGNPNTRFNDGRTDRQGRLVVGGMNEGTGNPDSSVVRVDADGSVHTLFTGISCANSTCFSPDGATLYFTDTPERTIRAYPYDLVTGAIGAPRVFVDMHDEPGLPDGSCVDAEGGVWNAQWEGSRVVRFDASGRLDRVIELPVSKVTCCAFGGTELDTLYITTSRLGSDATRLEAEPFSGGLFAIKPGVRGLIDAPFAG